MIQCAAQTRRLDLCELLSNRDSEIAAALDRFLKPTEPRSLFEIGAFGFTRRSIAQFCSRAVIDDRAPRSNLYGGPWSVSARSLRSVSCREHLSLVFASCLQACGGDEIPLAGGGGHAGLLARKNLGQ